MGPSRDFDVLIAGAGPAGLTFARSLAGSGLAVALVDPQHPEDLAAPPFDGREIALTHRSVALLRQLGLWDLLPADQIHPLRDAQVLNGEAFSALQFDHRDGHEAELGFLVAHQLIRRVAFAAINPQPGLTLWPGVRVAAVDAGIARSRVTLSDGTELAAQLVVAADSRFSETRRAVGIPADLHDFGKTMLVCRMHHEMPHRQVAWEWFGYRQTLALLPLSEHQSSVVVTMPDAAIRDLLALGEAEFAADIVQRFDGRLGGMRLISSRHAYPLVAVYPRRFVAGRFALIGDAAVSMHPVTAHGLNFGLLGQDLLARAVRAARAAHADIGSANLLARYGRELRRATRPLYLATQAIAMLYTDDSPPARVIRSAALTFGQNFRPFRRALVRGLTRHADGRAATDPIRNAPWSLR